MNQLRTIETIQLPNRFTNRLRINDHGTILALYSSMTVELYAITSNKLTYIRRVNLKPYLIQDFRTETETETETGTVSHGSQWGDPSFNWHRCAISSDLRWFVVIQEQNKPDLWECFLFDLDCESLVETFFFHYPHRIESHLILTKEGQLVIILQRQEVIIYDLQTKRHQIFPRYSTSSVPFEFPLYEGTGGTPLPYLPYLPHPYTDLSPREIYCIDRFYVKMIDVTPDHKHLIVVLTDSTVLLFNWDGEDVKSSRIESLIKLIENYYKQYVWEPELNPAVDLIKEDVPILTHIIYPSFGLFQCRKYRQLEQTHIGIASPTDQ